MKAFDVVGFVMGRVREDVAQTWAAEAQEEVLREVYRNISSPRVFGAAIRSNTGMRSGVDNLRSLIQQEANKRGIRL